MCDSRSSSIWKASQPVLLNPSTPVQPAKVETVKTKVAETANPEDQGKIRVGQNAQISSGPATNPDPWVVSQENGSVLSSISSGLAFGRFANINSMLSIEVGTGPELRTLSCGRADFAAASPLVAGMLSNSPNCQTLKLPHLGPRIDSKDEDEQEQL
jgi:hypothetical protein